MPTDHVVPVFGTSMSSIGSSGRAVCAAPPPPLIDVSASPVPSSAAVPLSEPDSFRASTVLRCGNGANRLSRLPDSSGRLPSVPADSTGSRALSSPHASSPGLVSRDEFSTASGMLVPALGADNSAPLAPVSSAPARPPSFHGSSHDSPFPTAVRSATPTRDVLSSASDVLTAPDQCDGTDSSAALWPACSRPLSRRNDLEPRPKPLPRHASVPEVVSSECTLTPDTPHGNPTVELETSTLSGPRYTPFIPSTPPVDQSPPDHSVIPTLSARASSTSVKDTLGATRDAPSARASFTSVQDTQAATGASSLSDHSEPAPLGAYASSGIDAFDATREYSTLDMIFFWQPPSVFSQWTPSSFRVDGVSYSCAEQFFASEKARLFGDADALRRILSVSDPSLHKRYGRAVRNFDPSVWEQERKNIVVRGSYAKFSQTLPCDTAFSPLATNV